MGSIRNESRALPASLFKVAWRYLVGHPLQSALMLLGVALGVAVAVGVDVANASAERAFELSVEAVTGSSTHYVSGGPAGIAEDVYADLRRAGLGIPMAPVLSQLITSPQLGGTPLQLLGVDPFAEEPFRSYLYSEETQVDAEALAAFYTAPAAILLSTDLAQEFGLEVGDAVTLSISGQAQTAYVAGLIEPGDSLSRRALKNLVLADISTVQELSGRLGVLERIDLILPGDNTTVVLQQVMDQLPSGYEILPAEGRSQVAEQITAAFRTNLTAMSLLALVVGLFLIYNTMTFSVVQRRQVFGTLRALGVTGREIFVLVVGEALLVGLLGSIIGVLLGVLMGRGAVSQVSQTINDVFFTLTVRDVNIPASSLLKGGALGLAATFFAALVPAWEAAKSPPRRVLSRSQLELISARLLKRAALLGAAMATVCGIMLVFLELSLTLSFAATFGVTIGLALTTPWVTQKIMPWMAKVLGPLGPLGRLAPREVSSSTSRTSPAIAALMVAVAVTIGVSLMISSFRGAVVVWLDQILGDDIYGSVAGASLAEPAVPLEPELIDRVRNWPGVETVQLLRNVEVDSPYGPIAISASDNPNPDDGNGQLYVELRGNASELWQAIQAGAVIISEPLANRLGFHAGDHIVLFTPQGEHRFAIVGVFRDYSSSRGNVTMGLDVYRQLWGDQAVTAFSARVAPGQDIDAMVEAMRRELTGEQLLTIRSNAGLRAETLEVFDRTFLITSALQLITTVVAFVGVLSAMLAMQLEKQRQRGILKAIGLTGRQLWSLTLLETGLIGIVAGIVALPTGYILAEILLQIINVRSFGWSLQMQLQAAPFIDALLISVTAGLLAGIYPAYQAARRSAAEAMRFD